MTKEQISAFENILSDKQRILISMHRNPDGDALGSSLALAHYLKSKGKDVDVIPPNNFPSFLNWMPGAENLIHWEQNTNQAKKALGEADLVICLDFNDIKRLGQMSEAVAEAKKPLVVIDHHRDPKDFADLMISDPESCATAQMVFQLIEGLGDRDQIDSKIAASIYAGIMTDTGSFKFSSTTAETHRIAMHLLETGIEHWTIHEKIMDQNSEMRMKLMGYALNDSLEHLSDFHTAIISLSQEELKRFDFKKGDTEGFVNLALSIKGTVIAALFVESEEGYVKMSFRSKGVFPVNELASEHFNGGGHINAAGGRSDVSLKETIEQFKRLLPNYSNLINATRENL